MEILLILLGLSIVTISMILPIVIVFKGKAYLDDIEDQLRKINSSLHRIDDLTLPALREEIEKLANLSRNEETTLD